MAFLEKNNPKVLAQFLLLYYCQGLVRPKNPDKWEKLGGWTIGSLLADPHGFYVEAKPLSSLTDEDAIQVARIVYTSKNWQKKVGRHELMHEGRKAINDLLKTPKASLIKFLAAVEISNYLVSKGYAIPWNGITVQQFIDSDYMRFPEKKPKEAEKIWLVYEQDREYSRVIKGDQPICEVRAFTKQQAEEKARKIAQFMTGAWAVAKSGKGGNKC